MCRYAVKPHKSHWVCLECHFSCKLDPALCDWRLEKKPCPNCHKPWSMVDAGRDFKPPRKGNVNGWRAVAAVLASGVNYDSCGCTGPGYRPESTAELRRSRAR